MPDPTARPTATSPFSGVVASLEQLRSLYRPPSKEVAEKKFDHLPAWICVTVQASRFAFLATAATDGSTTVSPRGGDDGFVTVLDDRHIAIPDYPGNNLTDSLTNIVLNPNVGLILLVPGRKETIRIDGSGWLVTDPDVLAACERSGGRRAKAAIAIEVREVFFHCPASFQRADLWNPSGWRSDASLDYDEFIRQLLDPDDWPSWAQDTADSPE